MLRRTVGTSGTCAVHLFDTCALTADMQVSASHTARITFGRLFFLVCNRKVNFQAVVALPLLTTTELQSVQSAIKLTHPAGTL